MLSCSPGLNNFLSCVDLLMKSPDFCSYFQGCFNSTRRVASSVFRLHSQLSFAARWLSWFDVYVHVHENAIRPTISTDPFSGLRFHSA